jgi:hypothetical protein
MFKKIKLKNSNKFFKETSKIIPLSSQTFSKSHFLYDKKYYPLFASEGKGCRDYREVIQLIFTEKSRLGRLFLFSGK